ncbi:membrane protein implicated in regulation of membrane protease activity [Actinomycetospora succinea]|uniref:Membrane protein implicated in regulation of membrane protease activity n=1 Tax=Actinomycetospora succinea TaxID=663603 RepID=A0A4R6UWN0_9PSEU|nr:NfeD family protein [Actinomycetospora succinea]TDQ51828.1 membrane protein implicated in regulation of membrane protease activity [Actinomycetospora succinea]
MIPLLWAIAGVVLVAVELVTGTFVLLMLGLAALVTAGASALGAPLGVDVAVFGLSALALVLVARPALQRRFRTDRADGPVNAGPQALLGAEAEVVDAITAGDAGTVRIGGALWTARPLHDGDVLATGDPVVVVDIRGATAVVTGAGPAPGPRPTRPPLQGET